MDDVSKVLAARKGDDRAFSELMNNHKERLYKMAFVHMRNENDALEAVQETTYRAYTNLKKIKEPQYFGSWLIRILINYCLDELKRKQKSFHIQEFEGVPEVGGIEDLFIKQAVQRLELKYRHVIYLKYFEDLTLREIAVVMECPEGTVKTWLHKGLAQLRLLLQEEVDVDEKR